jgi:hypothetical protein
MTEMKETKETTRQMETLTMTQKSIYNDEEAENAICTHWSKEMQVCTCEDSSLFNHKCLLVGACKFYYSTTANIDGN